MGDVGLARFCRGLSAADRSLSLLRFLVVVATCLSVSVALASTTSVPVTSESVSISDSESDSEADQDELRSECSWAPAVAAGS